MQLSTYNGLSKLFRLLMVTGLTFGCAAKDPKDTVVSPVEPASANKPAVILAMNDIYRINGVKRGTEGGMARIAHLLQELKTNNDVLVLHGGDILSPSLLGDSYKGQQMIDLMNLFDGTRDPETPDASLLAVFGNHEFDYGKCKKPAPLVARINQSEFIWLAGNLDFNKCPAGTPGLAPLANAKNIMSHKTVTVGGIKFGIFGLTINNADYWQLLTHRDRSYDEAMDAKTREKMNLESYVKAATELTAKLRKENVDYVIALTHLDWSHDLEILERLQGEAGPDLIIGGHNHAAGIKSPSNSSRAVYKQTAEARDVGVHKFQKQKDGRISHSHNTVSLKGTQKTPVMQKETDVWLSRHEPEFCKTAGPGKTPLTNNCLEDPMGVTQMVWELEEDDNRGKETAIGNWLAEKMVDNARGNTGAFCQADGGAKPVVVSLLGSGSLRLNFQLEKGYAMQRREIEELFPFSLDLAMICTDGANLKAQLTQGLSKVGQGAWPHISGLNIAYKEPSERGDDITLKSVKNAAQQDISDSQPIIVITNSYIAGQGDGYKWGICPGVTEWDDCFFRRISTGKEKNAKLVMKNGENIDMKQQILEEFYAVGAGGVGPSTFVRHLKNEAPN